jgi:hypothetical protein
MATSSSAGRTIAFQTTSDTVEIAVGRIVTSDSSGNILATTVSGVDVPVAGVSATKVASRDAAAQKDISVQMSGVVTVPKITGAIVLGAYVYSSATTTTIGTGSGSTCVGAASATTAGTMHSRLGRCVKAATATDDYVEVELMLGN